MRERKREGGRQGVGNCITGAAARMIHTTQSYAVCNVKYIIAYLNKSDADMVCNQTKSEYFLEPNAYCRDSKLDSI